MGEADLEVGAGVHDAAEDEGGEGYRPVREVSDGVGQVVTAVAVADHRVAGLVDEDDGARSLGGLPQGHK